MPQAPRSTADAAAIGLLRWFRRVPHGPDDYVIDRTRRRTKKVVVRADRRVAEQAPSASVTSDASALESRRRDCRERQRGSNDAGTRAESGLRSLRVHRVVCAVVVNAPS